MVSGLVRTAYSYTSTIEQITTSFPIGQYIFLFQRLVTELDLCISEDDYWGIKKLGVKVARYPRWYQVVGKNLNLSSLLCNAVDSTEQPCSEASVDHRAFREGTIGLNRGSGHT